MAEASAFSMAPETLGIDGRDVDAARARRMNFMVGVELVLLRREIDVGDDVLNEFMEIILGACRNSFLFFVSDRIYLDSLKISE